jgi:hypothetical protein
MHVFEVRNAELLESITQQAAEHGITYAAIVFDRSISST